jgi:hypothetical protein
MKTDESFQEIIRLFFRNFGSVAMKNVSSFMKTVSGIQKLIRGMIDIVFILRKIVNTKKKDLGNAHPALCGTLF